MARSARIHIDGLADVEKALDNLTKAVSRNVLRSSMREAAAPMRDLAKDLVRVDEGELRESIIIGGLLNKSQKSRHRRLTKDERSSIELFVGPSTKLGAGGRAGHLVEFGTAPHLNSGQFAGTQHPGTAPQPFMRPAFDSEAQPTLERLKPILWRKIDQAAKRAARKLAKGGR